MWEENDKTGYNNSLNTKTGQIYGDNFSEDIKKYASDCNYKTYLEIGTWNGYGSTKSFSDGFDKRDDDYIFYSLECNKDKSNDAKKIYEHNPKIHILNEVIWNEEPNDFYDIFPECKTNKMYKHWNDIDIINMKKCNLFLERNNLPNIFDVILLDGGEFTTYYEFQKLKNRCKILLLDDIKTNKCKLIVKEILTNENEWKIIKMKGDRNGYLIAENIKNSQYLPNFQENNIILGERFNENTNIITNFNREYLKFLFPQRSRLTTEYSLDDESYINDIIYSINVMVKKDFNLIKNYLPNKCDSILDIGCGLGLSNIPIYKKYKCKVNLLDKTEMKDKSERNDFSYSNNKGHGFNKEYYFYNSMDASKKTLEDNGIKTNDIILYEVGNHHDLFDMKFDIISSLLSCGWHYPIETYLDLMKKTLSPSGIIIIDIRHSNMEQLNLMKDNFDIVENIYNGNESKHTGGNIGNRYVFKLKK